MLISAVHQSDLVIHIHKSIIFQIPFVYRLLWITEYISLWSLLTVYFIYMLNHSDMQLFATP